MKNPKRPFSKYLLAAAFMLATLVMARSAQAQATIEFYGENGTNQPPLIAPVGMNWFGGGYTAWSEITDATAPEGSKDQMMSCANSIVGYWGFQFYNYGTSQVVQQDMSAYSNGQIRFLLKSTENLGLQLEWGASSNVTLLIPNTGGVWKEIVVDLNLYIAQGMDITHVRVPFMIRRIGTPSGVTTWYVDHIRWTKPMTTMDVVPTTTFQTTGRKRQYTVIGRDSIGDEVVVYGTWQTSGGSGYTVAPSVDSRYTVVTIGTGSSNLTAKITTTSSGVSTTSANVPITPAAAQDGTTGLLSETIPGVIFGTDSDFGAYNGVGATINIVDNTSDFREGTKSTQVTLNVPAGNYAGFFIQAGITGSAETVTRNMADYYDGAIRFWLKAPAGLAGKLDMSIRTSATVTEQSKITLGAGQGAVFDNNWHAIVVPVAQFAKAVPFADLSRLKILFNMSVSAAAGSGGSQTFLVDNIRWDTRTPGTLTTMTVKPIGNATTRVRIPKSLKRMFIAHGYDANGVEVDIYPNWTFSGAIGALSTNTGVRTRLDASATPALGTITVTDPVTTIATTTYVDVADIVFTQSFNVYSDAGSGGQIGTDQSAGSSINLSNPEHQPGNAPEGVKVMNATYTITGANAYATWFSYEANGNRFLNTYASGYLHFWVKTAKDLEVSLRSDNIPAASNNAKFRLSDLGVPTDNTWQEVWLSLDDFKVQDPRFDFTQVKVYWGIAAIQSEIGNVTNAVFDVDDVKWYTADPHVPDPNKVYIGVKNKQNATSGLVLSFDNNGLSRAVTYDQALAAMAYVYRQDTALAQKVLDVYKTKYNGGSGFAGFANEYDRDTPTIIRDADRVVGPNAWIMLAALHYKAATGSTTYDAMISGIANWILTLQAADGAVELGFVSGSLNTAKSTEHNFDAYAAFRAYKMITGLTTYDTAATNIYGWLTTPATSGGAWNAAQSRFNTGELSSGAQNNDFALDTYSWAPLALSSYTAVVNLAEAAFGNTKNIDVNGISMTGFDFSGLPGNGTSIPYGQPVDKDAVWIEGTAHMVLAYLAANNQGKANQYLNEIDKAVYTAGVSSQALTYASNAGTGYFAGNMDSTHASLSSMCWYLFAKASFNPLQPVPLYGVVVKNISDNSPTTTVTWSATVPTRWVRANQYVEFQAQAIDTRPWGVQIYTDNKNAALTPRFQDPTPGITSNFDSDPAGMIEALPGNTTTYHTLNMGWKIQDSTAPTPAALQPYSNLDGTGDFTWFFFKDLNSPAIDANGNGTTTDPVDRPKFTPGDPYMSVKTNAGIQTASGSFFPALNPDFIYLEADYTPAGAQVQYKANIIMEYFIQ